MMIKSLLIFLIRIYSYAIRPLLPQGSCRFHPSCSEYARDSVGQYGAFAGIVKTIGRLSRCHPFSKGGVDLP